MELEGFGFQGGSDSEVSRVLDMRGDETNNQLVLRRCYKACFKEQKGFHFGPKQKGGTFKRRRRVHNMAMSQT